jgi:membrane protein YqaA with SNARE-associated domain
MEGNNKAYKLTIFLFLALFLVLIIAFYFFFEPEELVKKIGVNNGYMIAFVVSFFAGFSAITTVPFYSILLTFISGGMNPWILGIVAGISLSLGDMFLFYFGRKGRDIISGKLDRTINRMAAFFNKRKREKMIPAIAFIYISFIPLPNDWLLLFLASIRFPQKKMNLIIIPGDITHAFLIAFLASKGLLLFG